VVVHFPGFRAIVVIFRWINLTYNALAAFSDYKRIFEHLHSLRGNVELRSSCVQTIIGEATRFKKQTLVAQLEDFIKQLISVSKSELIRRTERRYSDSNSSMTPNHIAPKYSHDAVLPETVWEWLVAAFPCLSPQRLWPPRDLRPPRFVPRHWVIQRSTDGFQLANPADLCVHAYVLRVRIFNTSDKCDVNDMTAFLSEWMFYIFCSKKKSFLLK